MSETLTTPRGDQGEALFEQNLRPGRLDEFTGQERQRDNLRTYVQGALQRGEPLDHVLLHGPPGLGKTTMAYVIAAEMGVPLKATSGPVLEKKGDLSAILTDLKRGEVLFIDEIHRLRTALEEILYKAMEDNQLDLLIGQGPGARSVSIAISPFTLVGATTRTGLLSSPLRDRFGITFHLDFYNAGALKKIVMRSAAILGVNITPPAAEIIAARSRGTPRVANRLLRRLRDFAQVKGQGLIDEAITELSFKALAVDELGFDETDRRLLIAIVEKFNGGPVGLSTLATAVQEEKETVEDVYEPFLIKEGFIKVTSRGRVATEKALAYLGRPPASGPLFK